MADERIGISNKNVVDSLIQGVQRSNPRLYEILHLMNQNFGYLLDDLTPVFERITTGDILTTPPAAPTDLSYTILPTGVLLSWVESEPEGLGEVALYDVRYGTDWDTATRITRTPNLNVLLSPLTVGNHTYLIKSIGTTGTPSKNTADIVITIPSMGSISLTANCIDNNVLLSWTIPTHSFNIDHYNITRNGSAYGQVNSTFADIFTGTWSAFVKLITESLK